MRGNGSVQRGIHFGRNPILLESRPIRLGFGKDRGTVFTEEGVTWRIKHQIFGRSLKFFSRQWAGCSPRLAWRSSEVAERTFSIKNRKLTPGPKSTQS